MKNEMEKLVPQELMMLARFCQAAMLILNARMFTMLGLLMAFSMFAWAAWKSDYVAVVAACAFSLLVFLPLQRMELRREIITKGSNDEQVS